VAADKQAVKRHFKEMLMAMSKHRNDLAAYSEKGDAFGVARCKRLLKFNCSRIRKYCAKHDLELPHSVPPEGAE
jgi:hypothetical protein